MKIFEGQEKLEPNTKKRVKKPQKKCKRCNGTGSFYFEPTINSGRCNVFGRGNMVMCPCVKIKDE